ncbi:MAG: ABC transporter permease subunit [Alphaproteobacteria bacterium]|nr:ABC transporter permease subunit [Alphaproteobacteria bacterium]
MAASGPSVARAWSNERVRALVVQAAVLAGIVALLAWLVANTAHNLETRGLKTGFGFLKDPAFFDINQKLIEYSSRSSFGRALLVGLLNTLLVSALGIVAATILGFAAGMLRLSRNWLMARLATAYVEFTRNVPLLLQLIFWWSLLTGLPGVQDSLSLGNVAFLNNRGARLPAPSAEPGFGMVLAGAGMAVVAAIAVSAWAKRRRLATGRGFPVAAIAIGLIVGVPTTLFLALGQPLAWDVPQPGRFNFTGGIQVTPELVALWWALSVYTGAFIAEGVRGGILSVARGQTEAAYALGLSRGATMRKVVLPQALCAIVPPLTSQYLNLTKNSSLAVAIGYQDLVSVGGTVLNQSGRALEVVSIWIVVYLGLSLLTSLFMNWYNRRIALVER